MFSRRETEQSGLLFYQEKMEQFYNVMADVIVQKNYDAWIDHGVEVAIHYPELFLFEESICGGPYDTELEELLGYVVERGYRIVMNFCAPGMVLGSIAVRIRDKWFAFGECRNEGARESEEGHYVTEIWSLKYVLPNLRQLKVKLRYAIPIRPLK